MSRRRTPTDGLKENPNRTYEVGKGKPPEHTRFKPGQSGNPSGRPSKRKNIKTILHERLQETVTIKENGQEKEVTCAEVIALLLIKKAMHPNADRHSIGMVIGYEQEIEDKISEQEMNMNFDNRLFDSRWGFPNYDPFDTTDLSPEASERLVAKIKKELDEQKKMDEDLLALYLKERKKSKKSEK